MDEINCNEGLIFQQKKTKTDTYIV